MTAGEGAAGPAGSGERLAVFLPSLTGGGAERVMLNLARGFRELGHEVDLVVCTSEGSYRGEVPEGVRLVDLGAPRVMRALPGLVRYLRRQRPGRVYAALDHANVIALWARWLARSPTRVIVSIRDTISASRQTGAGLRGEIVLPLARLSYPRAAAIVAVSRGVADDAAGALRLDRQRIEVIANPVLTAELPALAAAPLAHPWFAAGQPPVVLGCGRLQEQKDFPTLLRAFALLRRQRPARLVILGEGPDRPALEAQARELGMADSVALPGFVANPFQYMARAAVFALSSIHEGSPGVLVQALACSCPAVATDCPSGPREILAGLPQGRLVPMRDPEALAAGLAALLDAPRLPAPPLAEFHYLTAARRYLALART